MIMHTVEFQFFHLTGIIMIFSWPMLAVTAIFFPAWLKPALPEGEWFQVLRLLHVNLSKNCIVSQSVHGGHAVLHRGRLCVSIHC